MKHSHLKGCVQSTALVRIDQNLGEARRKPVVGEVLQIGDAAVKEQRARACFVLRCALLCSNQLEPTHQLSRKICRMS